MATPSRSVIETLTALSSGSTTFEACALAAIDRNQECRDLNAIVSLHEGALLESARRKDDEARGVIPRGPLHGVLFAAKDNSFTLVNYETRRCLERYLAQGGSGITFDAVLAQIASPDVKPIYEAVANLDLVPETAYREALEVHRPALQRAFAEYFATHRLDALLVPTCCMTARPIGHDETVELNGKQVSTFFTYVRNTDPSSNAGIPSLSIPVGSSQAGLPVGALLEAPACSDRRLLAIALAIQGRYSVGSAGTLSR